jgi:hypothetical protein
MAALGLDQCVISGTGVRQELTLLLLVEVKVIVQNHETRTRVYTNTVHLCDFGRAVVFSALCYQVASFFAVRVLLPVR